MVRFGWHVEDGLGAHVPPGTLSTDDSTQVSHATCSIEIVEGKEPLQAIFTLPPNYLQQGQVQPVGVAIAHGDNASEWKGQLLTELATTLAAQGYMVVRYYCKSSKEGRRQRLYEKALDAAATSPYADGIEGWVLAGVGSGARVAAVVARRCRGTIVGCALLSYPLQASPYTDEPMPVTGKATGDDVFPPTDLVGPLLALAPPTLFVKGEADESCSTGLLAQLLLSGHVPCKDARLLVVPYVDQHFTAGERRGTLQQTAAAIGQFVEAITSGTLESCPLPRPSEQQAAKAPPGSLLASHAPQPASWQQQQQQPGSVPPGSGAAATAAAPEPPQLGGWRRSNASAAAAAPMQQDVASASGGVPTPDGTTEAARRLEHAQLAAAAPGASGRTPPPASWQQASGPEPDMAAPMQLDTPAVQRGGPAAQQHLPAQAQHSSSASGAVPPVEDDAGEDGAATSSDYDSGAEEQQQQQPPEHGRQPPPEQQWPQHSSEQEQWPQQRHQQQWPQHQQPPVQGQLPQQQVQPKGVAEDQLAAQLRYHRRQQQSLPDVQQQGAAHAPSHQWQPQQPEGSAQMPSAHPGSSMPPQQPGAPHELPANQQQQQEPGQTAGQPQLQPQLNYADLRSIGQVPLDQIWGGHGGDASMLASFMTAQQNADSPDLGTS